MHHATGLLSLQKLNSLVDQFRYYRTISVLHISPTTLRISRILARTGMHLAYVSYKLKFSAVGGIRGCADATA